MSRTRRNFTAQFKAKLVLEVLKGEYNGSLFCTKIWTVVLSRVWLAAYNI